MFGLMLSAVTVGAIMVIIVTLMNYEDYKQGRSTMWGLVYASVALEGVLFLGFLSATGKGFEKAAGQRVRMVQALQEEHWVVATQNPIQTIMVWENSVVSLEDDPRGYVKKVFNDETMCVAGSNLIVVRHGKPVVYPLKTQ